MVVEAAAAVTGTNKNENSERGKLRLCSVALQFQEGSIQATWRWSHHIAALRAKDTHYGGGARGLKEPHCFISQSHTSLACFFSNTLSYEKHKIILKKKKSVMLGESLFL